MSDKPHLSVVPHLPDNVANAEVVERLQFYLEEAKAGRIVGVAIAGYDRQRRSIFCIVPGENPTVLMGSVTRNTHQLHCWMDVAEMATVVDEGEAT